MVHTLLNQLRLMKDGGKVAVSSLMDKKQNA